MAMRSKVAFDIPDENKNGDCFVVAFENVMADSNLLLCHGIVSGTGPLTGVEFPHAWNETRDGFVIDESNGNAVCVRKEVYYSIGNIQDVVVYDSADAIDFACESGTYGPWDDMFDFDYRMARRKTMAGRWEYSEVIEGFTKNLADGRAELWQNRSDDGWNLWVIGHEGEGVIYERFGPSMTTEREAIEWGNRMLDEFDMKINKQSAHAVIYPFEDTSLHYDNEGGAYIYNYDGSLVLCIYEAEYGEDFWWTVFDANTYTVLDNMKFGLAGQSTLEKAIQNFLKKSIYADEFDLKQRAASRKRMADFRAEFVPHWDMDYYAIKYKIYQVRDSLLDYLAERDEHHPYVFMRWDFAKSHGFDFGDYWLAYEGEIRYVSEFENESKILEHIFEKFNMNHPSDFYGRSLSVSDIVEINGRYFYCDSFGFTEIDPYAHNASRKTASSNEIEMVVDGKYCDGYAYVTTNDGGVTLDVEVDVECWGDNGEEVVNSFFSLSGKNSAQNLAIELGFYVESEYGDELGIDFDHLEQQFKDYFKTGSKSAFDKNANVLTLDMMEYDGNHKYSYFDAYGELNYCLSLEIRGVLSNGDIKWEWLALPKNFDEYPRTIYSDVLYSTPEAALNDFNRIYAAGRNASRKTAYEPDENKWVDVDEAVGLGYGNGFELDGLPGNTTLLWKHVYEWDGYEDVDWYEWSIWAHDSSLLNEGRAWSKSEMSDAVNSWYERRYYESPDTMNEGEQFLRKRNRYSLNKNATRHFTYAEMQELDDEIEGRELHNATRLRYTTGTELA